MKEIGKVTHYYGNLGVVIVELSGPLKVGDKIKIVRGENEFDQDVDSMQVEHEQVKSAKKGDIVGLKVDGQAKEGAVVYLVEE